MVPEAFARITRCTNSTAPLPLLLLELLKIVMERGQL